MIDPNHEENLKTIERAADSGDLALVECQRVSDDEVVVMLCAIGDEGGEYAITPFAEMVAGNPYELYRPPNPDGGFHES